MVVDLDEKDSTMESEPINAKKNSNRKVNSWHIGKIFWGLLLILVGGLLLADNFGLISVNWNNLWQLWPLAVIAAGLSVLSFRNMIWRIVVTFFVLAILGLVAWVAIYGTSFNSPILTRDVTVNKVSDVVKQADVTVEVGATKLTIGTSDQNSILKAKLTSDIVSLEDNSLISGETQQVTLSTETSNRWWRGGMKNSLDVDVTRNLPLSLNVNIGASDTEIDMSKSKLREINIDAGASDINVKLGSLESAVAVSIDSGASSIVLQVPKDSGVQLQFEGGLSSKQLSDLSEISEGKYESSDYAKSKNKITVNCKIGVSSFVIERY